MKRLLLLALLTLCVSTLSAQTKTAYCDVYFRGGGRHLITTIMYDGKCENLCGRYNIGEILNLMAQDGWTVDRDIVIPRHTLWSLFTRHKLHFVLKKEYNDNENPFAYIDSLYIIKNSYTNNPASYITSETHTYNNESDSTQTQEVIYKGVPAIAIKVQGNMLILVALEGKAGNWDEANEYCNKLGTEWQLPSFEEIKLIRHQIPDNNYWLRDDSNETRAKYYACLYNDWYVAKKEKIYQILPTALINKKELDGNNSAEK